MSNVTKPIIAVAFYSTYGHTATLAEEVIKGVEGTGAIVKPYVFQETLPEEVLTKMHAGSSLKPKYPILTPDALREVDGLVIGAPTRYGRVPAQVSAFFDQCGQLWFSGALVGKFVTMFTSVASQHGGHETTFLTTMPFFAHQGMVYVPIGYANPVLNELDKVQGGTAYGASTVAAGDGHLQPTAGDLDVAKSQGKYFAEFVGTFVKGKHRANASLSAATTSAHKEVPSQVAPSNKIPELGYVVPVTGGQHDQATGGTRETETIPTATAPGPTPAPAVEPAAIRPEAPAAVQDVEAAGEAPPVIPEQSTKAPTTAAPATTTPKASTAAGAPKKKKGGLFGCCGDSGIDH